VTHSTRLGFKARGGGAAKISWLTRYDREQISLSSANLSLSSANLSLSSANFDPI
jgi:hypothetical protein